MLFTIYLFSIVSISMELWPNKLGVEFVELFMLIKLLLLLLKLFKSSVEVKFKLELELVFRLRLRLWLEFEEEIEGELFVLLVISIIGPALDGDSGVTFDSCVCCGTILINKMR